MNDLVAKRYVKALIDGRDIYAVGALSQNLSVIATAFNDDKFNSIISSPEIWNSRKVELISSFLDNVDYTLVNFIKLLAEKRRLSIIPQVAAELEAQLAKMNNTYTGVIYTNNELSNDYIFSIQSQFSRKFNVNLSLSQVVCDYDGIKVDIDGLGVEISFSKERFKSQMIDHILKAV